MLLVTGGAGYIGSHAVKALLDSNYKVLVLDNLSTGHKQAVDKRALFFHGDLKNGNMLDYIFSTYSISSVIHFAASCYVGESIYDPLKYYNNNVSGTISLLKKMIQHKIKNIIFSSSCTVYGIPKVDNINETMERNPINPYGRSKLMIEEIIKDLSNAYEIEFMFLRYFNVAGADPSGNLGEYHTPETHLIPNILYHLMGKKDKFIVYGRDYDTKDGTCIRDFIHVNDLVKAHIMALEGLITKRISNECYNLGSEKGYSVHEVITMCEKVTGKKAKVEYTNRRKGDPPKLIANSEKIGLQLGWKPKYCLKDIIETAWKWHQNFPTGYKT